MVALMISITSLTGCDLLDDVEIESEEMEEQQEADADETEVEQDDDGPQIKDLLEDPNALDDVESQSDSDLEIEEAVPEIDLSSIPEGYSIGERFPDFSMTDRNGNTVMLSSYRGKPLYINCFTTWCYYCNEEMPDVQAIAENYDCNVVLLDIGETVSETDAYASQYGVSLPINHVPDWNVGGLEIVGVPVSIILDANGIVVDGCEGMTDYDWMSSTMEKALGQ